MITEILIKKKFIHQSLQRGMQQIYAAQEKVITGEFYTRTGRLHGWASRAQYDIAYPHQATTPSTSASSPTSVSST